MTNALTNTPEFTVSELAYSLKRTVEENFGHVRVRGELGRVTIAKSGHCYLDIKDDKAVINSIVWKGVMGRLSMRPEEGMEVVCTGKLSTYPGRSNYQLIIESMELAGAGALMALFEKRKKTLALEGLFEAERKRELPFMPRTIGVVTSPTGAVIRDILHRIADRFPVHVIVWPVLVQGDKAADQIAAAITGFNQEFDETRREAGFPRPNVLIVARGGGSLEDLWCFNEENVVRAAAASNIPLIAAVGHETDWTLIDYAADYRAPTPTGAAEVAVPVLADWMTTIDDYGLRSRRAMMRSVRDWKTALFAARLPKLETILSPSRQRLDLAASRLPGGRRLLDPLRQRLALVSAALPGLGRLTEAALQRLRANIDRMRPAFLASQRGHIAQLDNVSRRLRSQPISQAITRHTANLSALGKASHNAMTRDLDVAKARLARAAGLLEAYSYQGVLARGYTLVHDDAGHIVRRSTALSIGQAVSITFADGKRDAVIDGNIADERHLKPAVKKSKKTSKPTDTQQADLF